MRQRARMSGRRNNLGRQKGNMKFNTFHNSLNYRSAVALYREVYIDLVIPFVTDETLNIYGNSPDMKKSH